MTTATATAMEHPDINKKLAFVKWANQYTGIPPEKIKDFFFCFDLNRLPDGTEINDTEKPYFLERLNEEIRNGETHIKQLKSIKNSPKKIKEKADNELKILLNNTSVYKSQEDVIKVRDTIIAWYKAAKVFGQNPEGTLDEEGLLIKAVKHDKPLLDKIYKAAERACARIESPKPVNTTPKVRKHSPPLSIA